MKHICTVSLAIVALVGLVTAAPGAIDESQVYTRVNLVSDIDGVARFTDPNLVNPWGLAFGPTTPFWVADNNGGVSTLYNGRGQAFPLASPLVVTIPTPTSPTGGTPTGIVFNDTGDFVISANSGSGSPPFLFVTEDGTILGWSPAVSATSAVIAMDNSGQGAVYKGLAIGQSQQENFLYATNFNAGVVEVYDKGFNLVTTFTDPKVDPNFAPFGIQTSTVFCTLRSRCSTCPTSTTIRRGPATDSWMCSNPTALSFNDLPHTAP